MMPASSLQIRTGVTITIKTGVYKPAKNCGKPLWALHVQRYKIQAILYKFV